MNVLIGLTVLSYNLINALLLQHAVRALKFVSFILCELVEYIFKSRALDMTVESTFVAVEHGSRAVSLLAKLTNISVVLINPTLVTV